MPKRKRATETTEPKAGSDTAALSTRLTEGNSSRGGSLLLPRDVTFSTRLTEEQRDRVEKAAELKGWTPSNLIRIAALEKSAHIINTATRTRFDFNGLAQRIASQLVKPEIRVRDANPLGEQTDLSFEEYYEQTNQGGEPAEAYTNHLSAGELESFRSAAKYGGTDFLNLIVEACESRLAPDRADLPKPVDPNS